MTITKTMMTSTPMMVPIIPRFMAGPPLVLLEVPASRGDKHLPPRLALCLGVDGLIRALLGRIRGIHPQLTQLRVCEGDSCSD